MVDGFEVVEGVLPNGKGSSTSIPAVYLLPHERTLYMIDSGAGEGMRKKLKRRLKEYSRDCDHIVLINTHGHIDHIGNNGVILDVPFETQKHYIHHKGIGYLVPHVHYGKAMKRVRSFHEVLLNPDFPHILYFLPIAGAALLNEELVLRWVAKLMLSWYGHIDSDPIEITKLRKPKKMKVGKHKVKGFEVGPFKLIFVAGHSPDSMLVFHEPSGDLVVGDMTFRLYPLWDDSDSDGVEDTFKLMHDLMAEGVVKRVLASHKKEMITDLDELDEFLADARKIHDLLDVLIAEEAKEGKGKVAGVYRRLKKRAATDEVARTAVKMQFPISPFFMKNIIAFRVKEDPRYQYVAVDRFKKAK